MKLLRNEKGVALVMVMIIAFIGLAMVSTLLFMITQGTRISGFQRTYRTTDEAGLGGAQGAIQLVKDNVWNAASGAALVSHLMTFVNGSTDPCLIQKLTVSRGTWDTTATNPPQFFWTACVSTTDTTQPRVLVIDADKSADFTFDTNSSGTPNFRVYGKIIDTIKGNTAANGVTGQQLGGEGVVSGGGNQISPPPVPTLYRIEVQAQDATNPQQKSKYSVLYAY